MSPASKHVTVFGADPFKNMEVSAALAKVCAEKFGGKQVDLYVDGPETSYEVKGPKQNYVLDHTPGDKTPEFAILVVSALDGNRLDDSDRVYSISAQGCQGFAAFITDCDLSNDDAEKLKLFEKPVLSVFTDHRLEGVEVISGSTKVLFGDGDAKSKESLLNLFDALEKITA